MLSPFQIEVQQAISRAILGSDFALAGGGALISQGVVNRSTSDLDFFTTRPTDVKSFIPLVVMQLRSEEFVVEIIQEAPTFVRLMVTRRELRTEVDFGHDARLFPTQRGEFTPVLSTKELAVDKVLAIFGRTAARDFIDLAALTQFFELEDLFVLAKEKDRGFEPSVFLRATQRFEGFNESEFQLSDVSLENLRGIVGEWRARVKSLIQDRTNDLEY